MWKPAILQPQFTKQTLILRLGDLRNDLNREVDLFFLHCRPVNFLTSSCRFKARRCYAENWSPSSRLLLPIFVLEIFFFFSDRPTDPKSGNTFDSKREEKGDGLSKNWNHDPRNKFHAIPRFPTGSFVVHIGDHLRLGIICSPIWGSFPVWGSFAVGDHLRRCTGLSFQWKKKEPKKYLEEKFFSGQETAIRSKQYTISQQPMRNKLHQMHL